MCNSENTCSDSIISCNPNGNHICQSLTIVGPINHNLTLSCSGGGMFGTCSGAYVNATHSDGLVVRCPGKNACTWGPNILCPKHGFCHVYCGMEGIYDLGKNAVGHCQGMTIDARGMESGSFRLVSHGQTTQHE
eukprot:1012303_1